MINPADKLTIAHLENLLQKQRLEELLYELREAVIVVDSKFLITIFNRTAEEMFGVKFKEVEGKEVTSVVKLYISNKSKVDLRKLPIKIDQEDTYLLKAKKDFIVNVSVGILGDIKNPREYIYTFTDVSKQKELEKVKEELISVASHELKTPITIVKSYLWMLKNNKVGNLNEKQELYINKAFNATERILSLVHDVLSVSKIEEGKLELDLKTVDICKNIKFMAEEFEDKIKEKNNKLTLDIPDKKIEITADEEQLDEILFNLFDNAVKFTKNGKIKVTVLDTKDEIMIEFVDNGMGIDRHDLPKLFTKFGRLNYNYQSVAEAKGSGLGLYIVKLYAEKMGGKVGADSLGKGKGSVFWFTLKKS